MPSLLEAIDRKYGKEQDENFVLEVPVEIFVPKKSPLHSIPALLVLNDCDIETAGDAYELQKKCQGVQELDLAQNKLERWDEVFGILTHMPRVNFVNLSFNKLEEHLVTESIESKAFTFLKNLVLNSTKIKWISIQQLLELLPSLEELHLSLNGYNNVELSVGKSDGEEKPKEYNAVKKLHFTANPIARWCEVCKLGAAFPNLESLVLAECPLQSLDAGSESDESSSSSYGRTESLSESDPRPTNSPHNHFRHLRILNLNNTLLSSWEDVEKLAKFPALQCLRIQGCPLFEFPHEYTEHERRQLSIARLPNVSTLNGGGIISAEEREDAERAFIRYYMEKPEEDRPDRYSDLLDIHGKLDPLVQIDLSPEKKVKVTFTLGEKSEVRCISVYQTVQELKQKLEPFTGFPAAKMRLFYVDQEMKECMGPEEMKFPNKQLYSYNITSGDEMLIDQKH